MLTSLQGCAVQNARTQGCSGIRGGARSAAAAVEMALVASFLGLLVYGMVELSRGMMVKEILSNAARKGCNTGIKPNKTNTDIVNDVNNILADNNIDSTKATITILVRGQAYSSTNPPKAQDPVSVQVSIPVSATTWGSMVILAGQQIESEAVVMMRQE